jgi:chromosome segregation ATPase
LIAADWTGTIHVFDGASGKQIGTLDENPPKLAVRVERGLKQLADSQAAHKKLADQLAAARAESQKRKADLDAAEKAARTAEDQIKAAMGAATKARSDADHLAADVEAGFKRIVALDPVIPLLKEAAEKALQAAAKLPGDKDVAATAKTVQSQFEQTAKQLADTKQAVIATSARLEKTRSDITATDKQIAEFKSAAAAARKHLAELQPLVKKTDEQTAQAQKVFDASSQSLAADQQEIQRWQAEIASRNKTAAR